MQTKSREDIDNKYKWQLEDIYSSDEQWSVDLQQLAQSKDSILKFKGKLNIAENILQCFRAQDKISQVMSRLYVYARMRQDQDVSVTKYKSMCDKIETLSVEISSLGSFITPELTANTQEFLIDLSNQEDFTDYSYALQELARNKEHTLSAQEENILAQSASFSDMFHDAFSMFDNADIQFSPFVDSKGNNVQLSHGIYSLYMQSDNREDRQKAFESMFGAFKAMINTIAVLYAGNVKKNLFYTKVRKYDTCLQRSMNNENAPTIVYTKLIENVNRNTAKLQEYLEYRREVLGYDKLHMYDLHTPIVDEVAIKVDYHEAQKLVMNGLKPLGEEYQTLLQKAFDNRWIDVYENKGKRSGAYSWGCYDSHPYVLLNYQPVTHDVFTIAHELGHAMHTYYSNKNQPYAKADYEIFVAEVASTVNEVLLLQDLLAKSEGAYKKFLLSYMLDMFRTTVFRQTQFAQFEEIAHKMAEDGEALTPEALCEQYLMLNKKYYGGKNVEIDEIIKYEWARIPHFYRSFYVYKYATGLISAVCIAQNILSNKKDAVTNYKKFLSAGGSMPPVEVLKLAGVDLTSDQPYKVAFDYFGKILDELRG